MKKFTQKDLAAAAALLQSFDWDAEQVTSLIVFVECMREHLPRMGVVLADYVPPQGVVNSGPVLISGGF